MYGKFNLLLGVCGKMGFSWNVFSLIVPRKNARFMGFSAEKYMEADVKL